MFEICGKWVKGKENNGEGKCEKILLFLIPYLVIFSSFSSQTRQGKVKIEIFLLFFPSLWVPNKSYEVLYREQIKRSRRKITKNLWPRALVLYDLDRSMDRSESESKPIMLESNPNSNFINLIDWPLSLRMQRRSQWHFMCAYANGHTAKKTSFCTISL